MSKNFKAAAALVAAGVLALSACGDDSSGGSGGDGETIALSGFSILEAANEGIFEDFQDTDAGEGVDFEPSYGASGDQSRAVVAGSEADVVHYSLETDVTRLVGEGLVAEDWKDNATNGIATSSVVVFVVRTGNPDGIEGWDDLVEPGVEIITPNPGSSGSARWNILAAWAHATGGTDDEAAGKEFITKLLDNVVALPGSGREATTAFTDGSGDVLLSYENEAIIAKQNGADIDYVVPDDTLLIQNPAAVTKTAGDRREVVPRVPDQRRGPGRLRVVRLPSGHRRCRRRRGRRARTTRPTRSRPRARSTPSTTTSVAGARLLTSTSATVKRATPSASSPSSSRRPARSARSRTHVDRPLRGDDRRGRAGVP